jgi:hypothetical protein
MSSPGLRLQKLILLKGEWFPEPGIRLRAESESNAIAWPDRAPRTEAWLHERTGGSREMIDRRPQFSSTQTDTRTNETPDLMCMFPGER